MLMLLSLQGVGIGWWCIFLLNVLVSVWQDSLLPYGTRRGRCWALLMVDVHDVCALLLSLTLESLQRF